MLVNETQNPPSYLRRTTGQKTTRGSTTRATTGGMQFNNMINYGNSRALVHVNDSRAEFNKAWGQTGTVLEGQPLAIKYNENVFGERGPDDVNSLMPDMISEEQ